MLNGSLDTMESMRWFVNIQNYPDYKLLLTLFPNLSEVVSEGFERGRTKAGKSSGNSTENKMLNQARLGLSDYLEDAEKRKKDQKVPYSRFLRENQALVKREVRQYARHLGVIATLAGNRQRNYFESINGYRRH